MQQISRQNTEKYPKLAITATKLYSKNKIKEAEKPVAQLLKSDWDNALHFFQTGIAAYNARAVDVSIRLYEKALKLPETKLTKHSDIYLALGLSYAAQGNYHEAIRHYDIGFELAPDNALILNNRSLSHKYLNNTPQALQDLRLAFSIMPDNDNILLNLANMLEATGSSDEALQILEEKLPLHQEKPEFLVAVGKLKKLINPVEALLFFRKAAHLEPKNSRYLNLYADIFNINRSLKTFDGLEHDLLLLLSNDAVDWKKLSWVIPQHLKADPLFKEVQPLLAQAINENADINIDFGKTAQILTNNVLLAALRRIRLSDPELEKLLELFRRQTLIAVASDIELNPALSNLLLKILTPIAEYCFVSEYVFSESVYESQIIEKLLAELEDTGLNSSVESVLKFAITCCYRQPHQTAALISAAKKLKLKNSDDFKGMIKRTLSEPLVERDIQKNVPKLTAISDEISLSVQEQYEENPYPRWIHFPFQGSTNIATHLATILPVLGAEPPALPKNPDVLIAGCGTGKQPISTAMAFPSSKLLAVDLSVASIAYAIRKTKELKIGNIDYGQADIMELRNLNRKFNIIECAGVLHHMNDPLAGWQVLCDILHDDGFMLIGLYSEIGRQDIVAAREFIKENQYSDSIEDIRLCRKSLLSLKNGHLAKQVIRHSDFYATSPCRDLIFHVQEHRFTVHQISKALETLGLEFLGFNLPFQHIEESYKNLYPDDVNLTNLDNWASFEEKHPDTFTAMYKFWVRKKR